MAKQPEPQKVGNLQIKSTKDATSHGIKALIYGASGAGKTRLAATCPEKPLILSAESGLLSLRGEDIPVVEVKDMATLREAWSYLATDTTYNWVILDSITEIAEVVLEVEKSKVKDPRMAYGALIEEMMSLVKAFRDLPGKNIVFIAKLEKVKDEHTSTMLYSPAMPGSKLGQQLPYLFDEVLYLRADRDSEGNITRFFQTYTDFTATAKDRSGSLEPYEEANLTTVYKKIKGDK